MNCFVCCTPYHVFLALHIGEMSKSDIYISKQFSGADELVERLKETGMFHKVSLIDEKSILGYKKSRLARFPVYSRMHMLFRYIFLNYYMKKIGFNPFCYDSLYFSYAFAGRMMYLYSVKTGRKMMYYYFEDGIGNYVEKNEAEPTFRDRLARKILHFSSRNAYSLLLTRPELYKNRAGRKLSKVPAGEKSMQKINMMNHIFPCSEENWKYRVIFFDTVRNEIPVPSRSRMDQMLNRLFQLTGNQMIVKAHPRCQYRCEGLKYWKTGLNSGFESDCYMHDFSNHILITVFSTSVFIPKMIFEQEPVVILLYKLFPFSQEWDETGFVEKFQSVCHDRKKVIVPNSADEFYDYMKKACFQEN